MCIGVKMRRLLVVSTTVCNSIFFGHPFLMAIVCFCIFLRVYFPFLFPIIVSASPVIVCTAILLGTLLLLGEANVHEIDQGKTKERKTKVTHEMSPSEWVFEDSSVVFWRNESFSVDRFMHERKDGLKKLIGEENTLLDDNSNKTQNSGSLCGYMPLDDEGSHDVELRKRVIEKVERGFDDPEKTQKMQKEIQGIKEVLLGNHYSMIQHMEEENLEVKNINPFAKDKETTYLGFSHESSWKQPNDDDDDDDEDNEDDVYNSSDEEGVDEASGSMMESSSNSSSGNILPMLDELHPLLNEETSRPIQISHCGSNASSRMSHKGNETINWSDDEMIKHADGVYRYDKNLKQSNVEDEYEAFDNDSNDNDEEEEVKEDKEDESKSAIKWTEDDQKNVIDLGTLEMERNQHLESLIAKRIAHRNLSMIVERNLIDLDGVDFPNNIPLISTIRNPFDYDDDNLGSAPSRFIPRKNPFDISCDSIEKKSHIKENNFRQEYVPSQHREPFFRRHQSFNVGPSFLGVGNIERHDFRWKPHFSLHKNDTQGTSNENLQRQLSEGSDSKVSSNPETESVSSTIEEKKLNEEDISQETEIISNVYHGSTLVECGNISFEDVNSFNSNKKVEDNDLHEDEDGVVGNSNNQESVSRLSGSEETTPVEVNIGEILLRMEVGEDEEDVSRSTLSSSSSEMNEESCIQKKYFHNEEQHSWLDETVVPTSFDNHDQPMEINKSKEWSGEETSNAKDADMSKITGTQNSMLDNITSLVHVSSPTSPKSLEDKSSFGENYFEEAFESLSSEGTLEEDDIKDFNDDIFLELNRNGDLIVKEFTRETQDEQIPESRIGSPKFDSLPNDPSLIEIREELIDLVVRSSKEVSKNPKEFHAEKNAQDVTTSTNTKEQIAIGRPEVLKERFLNGKVVEENTSEDAEQPSNSKDVQEKIVEKLENSVKVGADLQNTQVSSVDDIVVNTKEVEEASGEEELHWFDSSDGLEERNGKEIDYA